MSQATLAVNDTVLTIYNVHPLPPRTIAYTEVFHAQMRALHSRLLKEPGPRLVMGDFNITQHGRWMDRLERIGLRSAHVDRGRGWATTFPNGVFLLPPIRLDHALLSPDLGCARISEGSGFGSDHQPLILDLLVP